MHNIIHVFDISKITYNKKKTLINDIKAFDLLSTCF